MDELLEFCARMIDDHEAAARAAAQARDDEHEPAEPADRIPALARAAAACRHAAGSEEPRTVAADQASGPNPAPGLRYAADSDSAHSAESVDSLSLADAVAGELAAATARLPQRQREALALRESLRLSYEELAEVIGIEPVAVAPLLARARLRLQRELRGGGETSGGCPERDRALRTIALRQDHESVTLADDDWLLEHVGHCVGCGQAHAAMLEGSVRYRAWRVTRAPASAHPDDAMQTFVSREQ